MRTNCYIFGYFPSKLNLTTKCHYTNSEEYSLPQLKKIAPEKCLYLLLERVVLICCNGFYQRVARQQLCKHGPTRNNRGSCVPRVCGDVTRVYSDHVTCFLQIQPTRQ
jgi:hypothetical protein